MIGRRDADFSLSGLKTALRLEAEKIAPLTDQDVADLCAAFQRAVTDTVTDRLRHGLRIFRERFDAPTALVASGGVAANGAIRAALLSLAAEDGTALIVPPPGLCTDNGAMIAWAGAERLALGMCDLLDTAPRARWPLAQVSKPANADAAEEQQGDPATADIPPALTDPAANAERAGEATAAPAEAPAPPAETSAPTPESENAESSTAAPANADAEADNPVEAAPPADSPALDPGPAGESPGEDTSAGIEQVAGAPPPIGESSAAVADREELITTAAASAETSVAPAADETPAAPDTTAASAEAPAAPETTSVEPSPEPDHPAAPGATPSAAA
jgi:N6-L-threonylcarbamoyladenine synthase